jgi:hypothetical protein
MAITQISSSDIKLLPSRFVGNERTITFGKTTSPVRATSAKSSS